MKISTKGRYALRLMLQLALSGDDQYVKIREIAEKQKISDKYLEQIVTILSRAGYVRSIRGAGGGYKLAKKPEEYTVGMILRLTEGSLAPVACVDYQESECDSFAHCATIEVWKRLNNAIAGVVDSITLQDLVDIYIEKNKLAIRKE